MLTARLDASLESQLESYCADQGLTKSWVVAESLRLYLIDAPRRKTAWELGGHLVGRQASAAAHSRSENTSAAFREIVRAKHARRRGTAGRAV